MKMAKSHKIIFLITAFALSVMLALCAFNVLSVKAAESISNPNATSYFDGAKTAEFVSSGAKLTVETDKTVSLKNELFIEDMKIELGASENIKKLELVLTYDSYYVNGNKNPEGKFDKEIINTFDITGKSSVLIKVENNVVKVDGIDNAGDYYKITKTTQKVAKVAFKATLNEGATEGSLILKSINQKSVDEKYNQSFVLVDGKLNPATPVITLNSKIFVLGDDGKYIAYANQDYNVLCKSYSALETKTSGFSVVENDDITVADNDETYVHIKSFDGISNKDIKIEIKDDKDNSTVLDVKAVNKAVESALDEQNKAPEYVYDELALEAFKAELEKQYIKDGELVPLGTKISIPSMEDFVKDDRTPYDKLSKTLYYASKTEKTSSGFEFTLENVGDYYFYVLFTDIEGKGMEKSDFVELNEDGTVKSFGKYGSSNAEVNNKDRFIFYFNIDQDKDIVITAPTRQGVGYKGTRYTASKFEILSSASNKNLFKLEYSDKENPSEEDWVEIKKFSDVVEGYSDENYDYDTLKAINYNGEYSFTPDKVGKYRITVYVSSPLSVLSNSASTIIDINEEAKVITPTFGSWVKDNVWSVVFLSVGTLCLAGIIVLLCIKPKAKNDDEE